MFDARNRSPLPEGLVIELVTPLTAAGGLDYHSLIRLVERVSPYAAGIVAGSPGVGEALNLSTGLRLELFSGLLQEWGRRGPLFFGITAATWEETLFLAEQLEAEWAQKPSPPPVYWVDLPLWYHSNRGLPQAYEKLLVGVKQPLVLLNQPEIIRRRARPWKHLNLRTAVFKKLSVLPGITGLIYHGEISRFLNYHRAAVGRSDFALYEADESRFLARPGSRGVVSVGAQLFPAAWQSVTRACLYSEESAAPAAKRHQLWALSTTLHQLSQLYKGQPVALVKAGLKALGVLETDISSPATPPADPGMKSRWLDLLSQSADSLSALGEAGREK